MKATYALNCIRSTTAPEMSAAVMMAKVPWNAMNRRCGMEPLGSTPTPSSSAIEKSPNQALPSPKAMEYPSSAQSTPAMPSATKLIIIVLSAFLERTRPP